MRVESIRSCSDESRLTRAARAASVDEREVAAGAPAGARAGAPAPAPGEPGWEATGEARPVGAGFAMLVTSVAAARAAWVLAIRSAFSRALRTTGTSDTWRQHTPKALGEGMRGDRIIARRVRGG